MNKTQSSFLPNFKETWPNSEDTLAMMESRRHVLSEAINTVIWTISSTFSNEISSNALASRETPLRVDTTNTQANTTVRINGSQPDQTQYAEFGQNYTPQITDNSRAMEDING